MTTHYLHPQKTALELHRIDPQTYSWKYLNFRMIMLEQGSSYELSADDREIALVPLSGQFETQIGTKKILLKRHSVFIEMPQILYVPPGHKIRIKALSSCEFALGGAPATGVYPLKLFQPDEMKREARGGGPAKRQVNHILAHPLPAERLILFEVYVPGGAWSGWPPHCHDGFASSPYLEETYFYRFQPQQASFGIHRNYRVDENFNEVFSVMHNDLVLVTRGFHPTVAAPGSAMYFLNFLARDLFKEERITPPLDDKDWSFMKQDKWNEKRFSLPLFVNGAVDETLTSNLSGIPSTTDED